MRRAIAAGILGGVVLGGALATPAFAAPNSGQAGERALSAASAKQQTGSSVKTAKTPGKAKTTKKAAPSAKTTKTVVYGGYEFQVPASWPVYRVDVNPQTCVRYDSHAVYLGTPGADMQCRAGLIGRTETVSFIPGQRAGAGAGSGGTSAPQRSAGTEIQRLATIHATITQDTVAHEMQVALGSSAGGATVTGTYGTDAAVVKQVLDTLRVAPSGAASTAQSAPVSAQTASIMKAAAAEKATSAAKTPASKKGSSRTGPKKTAAKAGLKKSAAKTKTKTKTSKKTTSAAKTVPSPTSSSWQGVPSHWPVEIVKPQPAPQPVTTAPVLGFDTCAAPALTTMQAWRADYAAVGVYIGGANAACAQANLSASWIKSAAGLGYGMLPTYVGPQAPCWGGKGALISSGSAATEGAAAGADAVKDAQAYGLSTGSPIYDDMEAYKGSASCTTAVLAFLGAWDKQVAAAGYVSGVYSSQDSGIVDMQAAAVAKVPSFTAPQAIWIALWDNVASLTDGTLAWPLGDRDKQYAGIINQTIGGITLNIDKDVVGGPVAT
jgi:Domain of unknown function (DUF1906)